MSYNSNTKEEDPLLPNYERSPEIQGSRPQSIKDETENSDSWSSSLTKVFWKDTIARMGLIWIVIFGFWYLANVLRYGDDDQSPTPRTLDERVSRILEETPLIDGHNDLAISITVTFKNQIYGDKFKTEFENGGMNGHVDLPRLKEGKNGGAFWSAFVPCPPADDYSDANYANAVAFTYTQLDLLTRLQAAYPDKFSLPGNSSTALPAFKAGQYISPFGIEGLHQIGNSVSNLRHYYNLGARYSTLTHNCHNIYADAAITENPAGGIKKSDPLHGGVSKKGHALIAEMNRLGMIVDLSHVSVDTMSDVLGGGEWEGSAAPIMFSHSSAYSLCPHPRNVPDHILKLVKKTNSVVMINFAPDFVSCTMPDPPTPNGIPEFYPANSTLSHVVSHIMYIGELIGYEHVGLGSDFDGIPRTPEGLDDVSKFPDLVKEMLERGVTDEQASGVVGGNILRVWGAVDEVALKLQAEGAKPLEDELDLGNLEMTGNMFA